jgi:hypothetical protein
MCASLRAQTTLDRDRGEQANQEDSESQAASPDSSLDGRNGWAHGKHG